MGIRSDLSQLLSSAMSFLSTRADMASLEWSMAKAHWLRVTIGLAVACVLLLSAWLLANVMLIAYLWDTDYRYWSIGGLFIVYAVLAFLLLKRALRLAQQPVFPYTSATIKADMAYFAQSQATVSPEASQDGKSQNSDSIESTRSTAIATKPPIEAE